MTFLGIQIVFVLSSTGQNEITLRCAHLRIAFVVFFAHLIVNLNLVITTHTFSFHFLWWCTNILIFMAKKITLMW